MNRLHSSKVSRVLSWHMRARQKCDAPALTHWWCRRPGPEWATVTSQMCHKYSKCPPNPAQLDYQTPRLLCVMQHHVSTNPPRNAWFIAACVAQLNVHVRMFFKSIGNGAAWYEKAIHEL